MNNPKRVKLTGYILRNKRIGENSRLLTLLSAERGLEAVFLMRSQHSKKGYFQNSSVFSYAEVELEWKQKGNCWVIKEMNIIRSLAIQETPLFIYYQLSLWTEILIMGRGFDEGRAIYHLFNDAFNSIISTTTSYHSRQNVIHFLWQLSRIIGIEIDISECSHCHKAHYKALFLGKHYYECLCEDCSPHKHGYWLSRSCLALLQQQHLPLTYLDQDSFSEKQAKATARFFIVMFQSYLEQPLLTLNNSEYF